LNGRTVKLKGGCVHHDNGILGAASFYDSEYRRLELHKKAGYNAIRCAHNPPSRDMLDACDRLGLLVLDEAFDMWRMGKNPGDYHLFFDAWWKRDMEFFIRRDRNHPSVFMWSTGNEIVERNGLSGGYKLAEELADYARSLDPTRPVTNAVCTTFNGLEDGDTAKMMEFRRNDPEGFVTAQDAGNPFPQELWGPYTAPFIAPLDVSGYNYLDARYEDDGKTYPDRIICGTESFPQNIDRVWELVEKLPYVIGDFTWTSWDYLGEAGIGYTAHVNSQPVSFPWRLAYCGDFDLCGFDRPQLHYRKIVWGSDETFLAVSNPAYADAAGTASRWGWPEVFPEWAYGGYEGKPVTVFVYSRAEEVELFLNGKCLGKKQAGKANRYTARFDLDYQPGTLRAVSLDRGKEVSRMELVSPGAAAAIRITPERGRINADGKSLVYAVVEIIDAQGRRVPFDDRRISAVVTGAGTLAAFGTGRPVTAENYTAGEFTSWLGRCLAVVRSGYETGEAVLTVNTEGLGEARALIQVKGGCL
jgi:beta-galactosidase